MRTEINTITFSKKNIENNKTEIIKLLKQFGVLIIPSFYSDDVIEKLNSEFAQLLEQKQPYIKNVPYSNGKAAYALTKEIEKDIYPVTIETYTAPFMVELTESYEQQSLAIEAAWSRLRVTLKEDKRVKFGNGEWRMEASGPKVKAFTVQAEMASRIRPIFSYGYKLRLWDFNIRYCVAHVVRVDPERVIDDDLFDWLGAEWELISYLCEKGRVQGKVAVTG